MDLTQFLRDVWNKHGHSPKWVFENFTPSQFLVIFGKDSGEGGLDRTKTLKDLNEYRAKKGLKPVVPSWWGLETKSSKPKSPPPPVPAPTPTPVQSKDQPAAKPNPSRKKKR